MSVISPSDYRIKDFVTNFTQEPLVKKYLYRGVWVSGCQTTVHPITIDRNSIRIQWNCDKKIFQKFINRIVEKNSDIFSDGVFWKSDGSCPSTITFYFRKV